MIRYPDVAAAVDAYAPSRSRTAKDLVAGIAWGKLVDTASDFDDEQQAITSAVYGAWEEWDDN